MDKKPPTRVAPLLGLALWGLLALTEARVTLADPAAPQAGACQGVSRQEARSIAGRLYGQGDYQHAGECYQAAGDLARANLAFLKAAGPRGEDTARTLKSEGDAAKALFAGVGRAFRNNH